MVTPTVVHLVPRTHWDREWYLPFHASVVPVDLLGRPTGAAVPATGRHEVELEPWEIRTLQLVP